MSVEPFRISVSNERLGWIADRVGSFPWDAMADAGSWSAGTSLSFMRSLAAYWIDGYDWRAEEEKLNRHPQFIAEIYGQQIHFQHIVGKGERNEPLLLLHGWPGSVHEFDALIDLMITPDADGRAFTLVVPSLPGYGFSRGMTRPVGPRDVGAIMAKLMRLLGHDRYLVQGGDWGAMIATQLGINDPKGCKAIHINMVVPGEALPETDEEKAWALRAASLAKAETGYSHLQMTRPQTLAYAMTDSPVGVAAWIIEKFAAWSDLPRDINGTPDLLACYTRDQLLTNIMFYVAPGSFATSTWLYHSLLNRPDDMPFAGGRRCTTPTGVAAFPDPVFIPPPRSQAEKSYRVTHWTEMPAGGHFAAMEKPELLANDVKAFARKFVVEEN